MPLVHNLFERPPIRLADRLERPVSRAADPEQISQEDRPGTDWVLDWLIAHRGTFEAVVIPSNGAPVTSLLPNIENANLPDGRPAELPVIGWKGTDLSRATAMLFDRLESRKIRHLAHPGLDAAATSAALKVLGAGGWVIDRAKSVSEAAPLQAVIGAVRCAETLDPSRIRRVGLGAVRLGVSGE
jgi:hypothetical protein